MAKSFEGKVVLVTGGSSGIGKATALAFAAEGAKVVVASRSVVPLRDTVRMIEEAGGTGMFVQCDVSKATEVEAMVKTTVEAYGRLDCAFNNAGGGAVGTPSALIADCAEADWDKEINVNLKGVWLCMKYEIPQMLKQGIGAIVNTSSVAGLIVNRPGRAAYASAKHAVIGLTKAAAVEYAKAGIRVNAVCPGPTTVPWIEKLLDARPEMKEPFMEGCLLRRLGGPEEVAQAVLWLCSNAASFVTGIAMPVDGGVVVGAK
ncbi:MAG TPA: glucose 1-dehydrogenase [Syntrophorhabdaceae bacterium]|nr:glucose 1-dehydrogenase [Syntrophorhabdaceae bacterium]